MILMEHGKCTRECADAAAPILIRYGKAHEKMMCDYCSVEGAEVFDGNGDPLPRLQRIRDFIASAATSVNATDVIFSGDPRGVTVRLTFADGFTNDFAHEGVIVPGA